MLQGESGPRTPPIIDAHHHIWRMADLPWLSGPMQPRIFGDYEAIRRDYPIEEFVAEAEPEGVIGSVYVQVNWPAGQETEEVAWVQGTAAEAGWPHAIVGYVDFSSDGCAETLKALSAYPLMRGIRQQLHWHENPLYRFAAAPDVMNDATWRRNFARLAEYGWCFDLQIFAAQMPDAARLAADFPETPMILQHCGMPEDTSAAGMSLWADGMRRLADTPNVFCKFSGLGTFIHENSIDFIADITGRCLDLFGAGRCIFGSNFPVEKLWTHYSDLVHAYRSVLGGLPLEAQEQIFSGNAREVYRIDPGPA